MGKPDRVVGPLAEEQSRLVRDNLGLVAVHLRRYVHGLTVPRRDREWEDLFQEGCLGLIRAAMAFREERGIPFAAFALPRIHNAVSRALKVKFATVYVPPVQNASREARAAEAHPELSRHRPTVHSLSEELERHLPDERSRGADRAEGETIGDRLRGKYERAARAAEDTVSRKQTTRGDRRKLVRVLMEERLLVPHEESKTALRSIARQTKSSYARVAQCDKQLGSAIRQTLDSDPEFHELRRRARSNPDGGDVAIDAGFEHDLASIGAGEFVARFRRASPKERADMLTALMEASHSDIEELIHHRVARLSANERERLFQQTHVADARRARPSVVRQLEDRRQPDGVTPDQSAGTGLSAAR